MNSKESEAQKVYEVLVVASDQITTSLSGILKSLQEIHAHFESMINPVYRENEDLNKMSQAHAAQAKTALTTPIPGKIDPGVMEVVQKLDADINNITEQIRENHKITLELGQLRNQPFSKEAAERLAPIISLVKASEPKILGTAHKNDETALKAKSVFQTQTLFVPKPTENADPKEKATLENKAKLENLVNGLAKQNNELKENVKKQVEAVNDVSTRFKI